MRAGLCDSEGGELWEEVTLGQIPSRKEKACREQSEMHSAFSIAEAETLSSLSTLLRQMDGHPFSWVVDPSVT